MVLSGAWGDREGVFCFGFFWLFGVFFRFWCWVFFYPEGFQPVKLGKGS